MRPAQIVALFACALAACALVIKSPALRSPLKERLAKAETPTIEDAAKTCFTKAGWKPDDIGGLAEGATVVSATTPAKERVSIYIQAPATNPPRVTGGPDYSDPFWTCLDHELGAPTPASSETAADSGT